MKQFILYLILSLNFYAIQAQTQLLTDQPIECPYFPEEIITGGEYLTGCPNKGYIFIPHLQGFENQYSYSINNGISWQSTPYFANLPQGDYNCKMKLTIGSHSCIVEYPMNPVKVSFRDFYTQTYITELDYLDRSGKKIIDTVLITQPTNCGLGIIDVRTVLGGGGYLYSIDGTNFQNSKLFYNVPVGKYEVYVKEMGSSCPIAYRYPINIYPTNYFKLLDIQRKWECESGKIIFSVNNSSGVEYSIDNGSNWQSNSVFTSVSKGHFLPRLKKSGCILNPSGFSLEGINHYKPQIFDINFTPGPCTGLGTIQLNLYSPNEKVNSAKYFISYDNTNFNEVTNQLPGVSMQVPTNTSRIYIRVKFGTPPNEEYCNYYFNITPTTGILPDVNYTKSNPQCLLNNGSISFIPPDGQSYEFSINNGTSWQSNPTFSSLSPGSYTITYRNTARTCFSNTVTITLTNENLPPIINSVVKTDISDCGLTDGKITINSTPGTGNSLFSINNGNNWFTNNQFNNLNVGDYNIKLKNNNNSCEVIYVNNPVHITAPTPPSFNSISFSNVTDCGLTNGSITISANAGSAPLEYSINNGSSWQTSNSFTNLDAGSYQVKIKNNTGTCIISYAQNPVIITKPTPPTFNSVTFANTTDCSLNDGTISINATQGSAPLRYSLDNGNSWQTNGSYSNLAPGNYNIKIKNDNNTCIVSYNQNPVVIPGHIAPVINSVIAENVSNCGLTDGKITINATPGEGNISYSIDNGSSWLSSNVFTGLSSGTYNVKIKNNNNTCKVTYSNNPINITAPTPPSFISVSSTNVTDCGLTNGSITISASAGSAPLEYSINNGTSWQASNSFTNLDGGSYQVKIRNNTGTCIVNYAQNPIIITKPAPPTFNSVTYANTTDCSLNDGTISINATQGSAPLRYSIDNGNSWQSSGSYSNLAPGSYTIKIKNDNNTCLVSYNQNPIIISGHTAPVINSVSTDDVTNCGLSDGKITINANPGEGNVLYSIDNGNSWSSSNIFANLSAGNYNIKVKNNNGTCITSFSFNPVQITAPIAPAITNISKQNITDCNLHDGIINITAQQGSASLEYSINDGTSWQTNKEFQNLSSGNYQISVRNQGGTCKVNYTQNPVVLTSPVSPQIISVISTNVSGCDINDGSITIHTTPGSTSTQYSIDNGNNWSNNNQFTGLAQGTYYIKVRNADGTCTISYTQNPVVINAPLAPSITNIVTSQPTSCINPIGSILIEYLPGSGSPQFTIDGGQSWVNTNNFTGLSPGTYTTGIRNSDGSCASISNAPVIIVPLAWPEIVGVVREGLIGCTSGLASLHITATGSSDHSLLYSIDDGGTWGADPNFSSLSVGNYMVKVKYSTNVCEVSYTQNPVVLSPIPNPQISNVEKNPPISCNDPLTGSILITGSDENQLALSYSINNGNNWQSGNTFSNLAPGAYFIAIKNSLGCTNFYSGNPVELNAPAQPIITNITAIVQPDCNSATGSFTIQYNAAQPVQFSINNGISWYDTPQFSQLGSGNYYIKIRNSTGECENNYLLNPVVLADKIGFTISQIEKNDPTDCNSADGTISISVTPLGDYQYSINSGTTFQNDASFTNLPAGNYHIKVKIRNTECVLDYTELIRLNAKNTPKISATNIIQPGCGTSTGSIEIISPDLDVQYSIDSAITWKSIPLFAQLAAGVYHPAIRFTGSNCVSFSDQEVHLLNEISIRIEQVETTDNTECTTPNGSIKITANEQDLEYSIDDGTTWQSSNIFSGLAGGQYRVKIKKLDCVVTYPVAIIINSTGSPFINLVSYLPTQNCDRLPAYILINSSESDAFSIDGGESWQSGSQFNNLDTGHYTLAVRKGGCVTFGQEYYFTSFKEITTPESKLDFPTTCNSADGSIRLIPQVIEYVQSYSIDGGVTYVDSCLFIGLGTGLYYTYLRSVDNCIFSFDPLQLYADGTAFISDLTVIQPEQCADTTGQIIVHLVRPDIDLLLSTDGGINWQQDTLFNDLPAGVYRLLAKTMTDICQYSFPDEISIQSKNIPKIDNIEIDTQGNCESGSSKIVIEASGKNLLYSIDGGLSWQSDNTFSNLPDGYYELIIKDSIYLCQSPDSSITLSNGAPDISNKITTKQLTDCNNKNAEISIYPALDLHYSIDNGLSWQNEPVFKGLGAGSYLVVAKNIISGCKSEVNEVRIGWSGIEPDRWEVHTQDAFCKANGNVEIKNTPVGIQFSIDGGNHWQLQNYYTLLAENKYEIILKDQEGCTYDPGLPFEIKLLDSIPYSIENITPPTCQGMVDGEIHIEVQPNLMKETSIVWPDGSTGTSFIGAAGSYIAKLILGKCKREFKFTIPESKIENFEWSDISDTILCAGRKVTYHLDSIYQYQWYSANNKIGDGADFSTDRLGYFDLVITDSRGCKIMNQWLIDTTSAHYDLDFLLPSEGLINQGIIAVDISWPPADSMRWLIDSTHLNKKLLTQNQLHLLYTQPGIYTLKAEFWKDDCHSIVEKSCRVFGSADSLTFPQTEINTNVLSSMTIFPNPNNGNFRLQLEYYNPTPGSLSIYNSSGIKIYDKNLTPDFTTEIVNIDIITKQSGVYSLLYRAQNGETHWQNFIIIK